MNSNINTTSFLKGMFKQDEEKEKIHGKINGFIIKLFEDYKYEDKRAYIAHNYPMFTQEYLEKIKITKDVKELKAIAMNLINLDNVQKELNDTGLGCVPFETMCEYKNIEELKEYAIKWIFISDKYRDVGETHRDIIQPYGNLHYHIEANTDPNSIGFDITSDVSILDDFIACGYNIFENLLEFDKGNYNIQETITELINKKDKMKYKVKDKFEYTTILDKKFIIIIVNINEFREPHMQYAVDVYDETGCTYDDVSFLGEAFLNKCKKIN